MGFALDFAQETWKYHLDFFRNKGVLAPGEQVEAIVGLFKRSQLVFLTWFMAPFLQRQYLLVVTDRRVFLVHIPAFAAQRTNYAHAEVPRPCELRLPGKPKAEYGLGAKVNLPEPLAKLVGRGFAYVVFGEVAQRAFDLAGTPPAASAAPATPPAGAPGRLPTTPPVFSGGLVRFMCPTCGKELRAKSELAGRRVKCSGCGHPAEIPSA